MLTEILTRAGAATAVAWAGSALGAWAANGARRHLGMLAAGAMGVLLAVIVCDVLPDAWAALSPPVFLAATASGTLLFWAVSRFAAPLCPACILPSLDAPALPAPTAALLTAALTLHSLMDGVALAAGSAGTGHPSLALALAVSLHKLPEGLALALLLRASGLGAGAAFGRAAAVESSTLLGGLLGASALRAASPAVLGVVFAHVGGGFLFLAASMLGVLTPAGHTQTRRLISGPLAWSGGVAFTLTAALLWTLAHFEP